MKTRSSELYFRVFDGIPMNISSSERYCRVFDWIQFFLLNFNEKFNISTKIARFIKTICVNIQIIRCLHISIPFWHKSLFCVATSMFSLKHSDNYIPERFFYSRNNKQAEGIDHGQTERSTTAARQQHDTPQTQHDAARQQHDSSTTQAEATEWLGIS